MGALEPLGDWQRTHHCAALRLEDVGARVTLMGWVARRRDHGGVIFIDLRDREGITQVVFNPQHDAAAHAKAESLRSEYVIAVRGVVEARPEGMVNPRLQTGQVEVNCEALKVLNAAASPPLQIEDELDIGEDVRLRYRYLDLRRPRMVANLRLRHRAAQLTRAFMDARGFLEVETPFLIRSTPEGARDYLVPSRVHPGLFYALPQSPQTYKQLLMVAGLDRYFQIVKCFRDEDLRADRQPEFTQIDVEMSFVRETDVMEVAEALTRTLFREVVGVSLPDPFPRLEYAEAMARYGSDKPDLRFGLELRPLTEAVRKSEFKVFRSVIESKGEVRGINVKSGSEMPRSQIDDLGAFVQRLGAKGLAWMRHTDAGLESSIAKFFPEQARAELVRAMDSQPGDLLLFVADQPAVIARALGALRLELARRLELVPRGAWAPLWVTHFPLLEYDDEAGRCVAKHHPFTAPLDEDLDRLESAPLEVRAKAYDLVLNGNEVAGGSIRIFQREVQTRLFDLLALSREEAQSKFGFLLDALEYGAPPHGGIAFGYDRLIAMMCGEDSIRDVIAFPKTNKAVGLMERAPGPVSAEQLRELAIRTLVEPEPQVP